MFKTLPNNELNNIFLFRKIFILRLVKFQFNIYINSIFKYYEFVFLKTIDKMKPDSTRW